MSDKKAFNDAANTQRVFSVRFSTPSDSDKIVDYYKANKHEHVDDRPEEKIRETADAGRTLIIVDENNTILAASCAYDYGHPKNAPEDNHWTEIGSTRAQLPGFGLYPFIIASQVLHDFLDNQPSDHFFASIYNDNQAVAAMLEHKVGWSVFHPCEDLIDASGERENMDKLVWLKAETGSLPHQARLVSEFMDKASKDGLQNKKTGEIVKVDFSKFSLANEFSGAVKTLSSGGFAAMIEAHDHIGARAAHSLLTAYEKGQKLEPKP